MNAVPRLVHPAAWWLWAICLAAAAMRTTNILLLLTIAAVVAFVVSARRGRAPWADAYRLLLMFAGLSIVFTMLLQVLLGVRIPGHEVLSVPSVPLPDWTGGLTIGGPVTAEALLNSFDAGLRLAVLITCFGAANALAHPARLVRILPAALYEVGVAIVVALTFVPQLAESVNRIHAAQRLRGAAGGRLRRFAAVAVCVLAESLDRAISLAASMDSRGYGRRAEQSRTSRRVTGAAVFLGLGGAVAGTYQVIDPAADHRLGALLLAAGTALSVLAGLVGGRRTHRTRYRPDPWGRPEFLVVACGLAVLVAYRLAVHDSVGAGVELAWPTLEPVAFLVTLLAALPAVATPPVPGTVPAVRPVAVAA